MERIEFVQVVNRNHLRMRVWERGSGVTLVVDKISIGGIVIEWDSQKSALKINGSIYATGTVGSIG